MRGRERAMSVSVYRCYLLDADNHMIGSELFRGTDDEAAIRFAKELCARRPEKCHGIELWQAERMVFSQKIREGSEGAVAAD
jgi:hypothetical protein